jgi:hypothetical protein
MKKITLKSYIKKLQELAEKNPKAILIYSTDEEGNGVSEVTFEPQFMFFDPEDKAVSDVDYDGFVDAICLN